MSFIYTYVFVVGSWKNVKYILCLTKYKLYIKGLQHCGSTVLRCDQNVQEKKQDQGKRVKNTCLASVFAIDCISTLQLNSSNFGRFKAFPVIIAVYCSMTPPDELCSLSHQQCIPPKVTNV